MQTSIQPSPRHYKHSLRLLCCVEGTEQPLQKGQKEHRRMQRHIKDSGTGEHVRLSLQFRPGVFQWKAGSWHCWWKLRSGAHIFNPVIIDSSKAGTADMWSRMRCADFTSNTPSNHCLQLQSTNHKLLTTRNKTGQRSNCSSKSVSQIIKITKYLCFQVYRGCFCPTHLDILKNKQSIK